MWSQAIPLGLESPGGLAYGPAFLERGFKHALEFLLGDEPAPVELDTLRGAFWFGVALRDAEPVVDEFLNG